MAFDIALRSGFALGLHILNVSGKGDVRYFVIHRGSAASEFRHVFYMGWTHYACVVSSHVHEETVQRDILLRECVTQIMVRKSCDGQNGSAIKLGIIKSIEQVNATRARSGQTHAELSGELRISTGHKRGSFFMPDLNKPNLFLVRAQ